MGTGLVTGRCPAVPGYQLWPGAQRAFGAAQLGAPNATAAALAWSCNLRTDCRGFTTAGQIVLSPLSKQELAAAGGNNISSTGGATSCEGLYVRADLLDGEMTDDLTGLEVSHEFDLDVPYYRRVPWGACKQLCLGTPGCRSVSFLASEELCTMKTATCVEAGLGSGCVQRHASTGYFLQSDRAGTGADFVAGTPETSLHYLGLSSQPLAASEAEAACSPFGGARPASLHTTSDLRALLRAAEKAAARMGASSSNSSSIRGGTASVGGGPYVFWLYGVHSTSSGRITWLDSTRYVLPFNFSVSVRGGCTAVVVANGTASLATRACTEQGAPVCAVYAPGDPGVRFQTDSTMVVGFNDRMGPEDAVNFCAGMGAMPHRPVGARGREALAELMAVARGDIWIDGNGPLDLRPAALSNYTYGDGSLILPELWANDAAPGPDCISAAVGGRLNGWLYPNTCDEARHVACQWPVRNGPGASQPIPSAPSPNLPSWEDRTVSLPARVRLHRGGAYLFITNPTTYPQGVDMCKELGGNMVSIHDGATDTLLMQVGRAGLLGCGGRRDHVV
ncbi:hypothetical protein HXX76_001351 [Chlamydomonas incerta]|uniref:C-type lectin domain-containing protein n=1 Tax=Chlamydomonas incerta TaxID=51695 RepID=A0A836B1C4_CHLIN|nr:hypothetical protein HXX76_001351 [Chlamydomonas incerta]|eukprot:KAG2444607.1 hypothetical protein HXX76_001351 [Chlamydomonas incerta]